MKEIVLATNNTGKLKELQAILAPKGRILKRSKGLGDFGYDPLFYCEDYQCTLAELPAVVKNTIRYRAKALQQLALGLQDYDAK